MYPCSLVRASPLINLDSNYVFECFVFDLNSKAAITIPNHIRFLKQFDNSQLLQHDLLTTITEFHLEPIPALKTNQLDLIFQYITIQ